MQSIGRSLIILGGVIALLGLLLMFGDRLPLKLGRLPGDILYKGKNTVFYFPLATSILVSVVLSLVFWWIGKR